MGIVISCKDKVFKLNKNTDLTKSVQYKSKEQAFKLNKNIDLVKSVQYNMYSISKRLEYDN